MTFTYEQNNFLRSLHTASGYFLLRGTIMHYEKA
jgi:hypothetical protein